LWCVSHVKASDALAITEQFIALDFQYGGEHPFN